MSSTGHRANILNRTYREVGFGRYNHYYVQDFGAH
ncbi:MAG: CAP domain-containing protein [Geminicoccaceae bacterium]